MWLDEANSVRIAGNSLPGILREVRHDNEANTILKDRLDRRFWLVEQRDFTGSSFDRILVYQPPSVSP